MNATVSASTPDVRRARRAFLVVGLVVPIVITAVATALIAAWLPDLPDQITTHWGPEGPNGYSSPTVFVWVQAVLGLAIPLLLTLPILVLMKNSWGVTCRLLAAVSLGTSALLCVAFVGSVAMQRESVSAAWGIGPVLALGFGALILLGLIGWFVQPNVTTSTARISDEASPHLRLAPGEKVAWFGTAAMGRPGIISLAVSVLILCATTVWVFMIGDGSWWILALVTLLVVALIATTLVFRVRVSSVGLRVRSAIGWPRWNIAASEIADVKVVQVVPMAEFGGCGLRFAVDGRTGIVLRTGEALQVTRNTGRVFVVTIDDARTAASVLITAAKESSS
ncbi:DUF1648 domain-containing protein [Microbacterium murale]|uniref:DUF1648 domain-containing protein n=1 Tax=Microbacterium murale TaxID=1081040 RepID=A0ABU0PDT1_9MICO|nr:DUF1648 domain-containing protein [Microbacterium murale]MDQ0644846.1 hypothetical protein [Microbacterium murale]